jgi:hypothetical protein
LKLNLVFHLKKKQINNKNEFFLKNIQIFFKNNCIFLVKKTLPKKVLKNFFLSRFFKKNFFFFYLNKFIQYFLESFFKKKILINIKKGSSGLVIKQINSFYFYNKLFKKNLKISKQIVGILYYSILLKDSIIFSNFFKKKIEKINIKLHKKLLLGLKKLIKFFFLKKFIDFGLKGIFLNIKGKLGVSGNAKKRRYFFYFGRHSITKKTLKFSHKHTNI